MKNYYSLYLTCAYNDRDDAQRLKDAFQRAGKTLDMGKSCLRFKSLDDLPLPAIGELIASVPPAEFIARYERTRAAPRPARPKKPTTANKSAAAKKTPVRKRR